MTESSLQPAVDWMQQAELCIGKKSTCPGPSPGALTIICSGIRMLGACSALTQDAWPSAPFPGEGRGASKRLRCPTVKYLISQCTKNGFLQDQRKGGYFLPALAELTLCQLLMVSGCFYSRKFRVTSTTLAPEKSVTDYRKLRLVFPNPTVVPPQNQA